MQKALKVSLVVLALVLAAVTAGVYSYPLIRQAAASRVRTFLQSVLSGETYSIPNELQRRAVRETAEFVEKSMPRIRYFPSRWELLDYSLKQVGTPGLYCEFGVAEGESLNFIADRTREKVHGFDSFEGLPEDWQTGFVKGTFAVSQLPRVRANAVLYKGWFSDTLPKFKELQRQPLAFAHMDADLYSSTRDVFQALNDRFVPGTVIVFDEFFNYPGWKQGEYRAFNEFIDSAHLEFQYLGYSNQQVGVKILSHNNNITQSRR